MADPSTTTWKIPDTELQPDAEFLLKEIPAGGKSKIKLTYFGMGGKPFNIGKKTANAKIRLLPLSTVCEATFPVKRNRTGLPGAGPIRKQVAYPSFFIPLTWWDMILSRLITSLPTAMAPKMLMKSVFLTGEGTACNFRIVVVRYQAGC